MKIKTLALACGDNGSSSPTTPATTGTPARDSTRSSVPPPTSQGVTDADAPTSFTSSGADTLSNTTNNTETPTRGMKDRIVRVSAALLTFVLCSPPVHAAAVPRPGPPAVTLTDDERATIDRKVEAVRMASDTISAAPNSGTDALRIALDALADAGALAAMHDGARDIRIDGLLTLARVELLLQRVDKSTEAMDEAIRITYPDGLPVGEYGSGMVALYHERVRAPLMRPMGSLQVTCTHRCRVTLDDTVVLTGRKIKFFGILLGAHRVDIEPEMRDRPEHLGEWFSLDASNPTQAYAFPLQPPGAPLTAPGPVDDIDPGSGRKLPRWLAIAGIAAGSAAIVAGATLIGVHNTSVGARDECPDHRYRCTSTLNTRAAGIITLSAGAVSLVGFGVVLGIDGKGAPAKTSFTIGTALRF